MHTAKYKNVEFVKVKSPQGGEDSYKALGDVLEVVTTESGFCVVGPVLDATFDNRTAVLYLPQNQSFRLLSVFSEVIEKIT